MAFLRHSFFVAGGGEQAAALASQSKKALMLLPMSSFVSEPRSESETSFSKAGKPCESMVTSESRAQDSSWATLLLVPDSSS